MTSTDTAPPFDALLAGYLPAKLPPVWSLLVTLFGDLAQGPEAALSGATLTAICEGIGIKPEALRVALHRLRRDNWITSTRSGRASTYALTDWGRAQSKSATPRIYGQPDLSAPVYLLICDPAGDVPEGGGMVPLTGNLVLSDTPRSRKSTLSVDLPADQPLPDWITAQLCPPSLNAACKDFLTRLSRVEGQLTSAAPLTPVQTAALRGLIVHDWRRIILKVPPVAETALGAHWPGPICRDRVSAILKALEKPSAASLNTQD